MGYYLRAALGLALIGAGVAVMAWSVYELIQIGTCASGGPYEVARECPEGTATKGLVIFPAVIVVIAGIALFATRGRAATAPGLPPKA